MRAFNSAFGWLCRLSANTSARTKTLLAYALAGAIIWFVSRGISLAAMTNAISHANLALFLGTSAGALTFWLLGETLLFSRLFTYFHRRTRFREVLIPNATQYFLQIVNLALAHGAMIVWLSRRKRVPLLTAGCTMLFQGFVDFEVLVLMALAGLVLTPSFPLRGTAWYLIAVLSALGLASWFWMRGRPTLSWARYVYDLPAMTAFRRAGPWHYIRLIALRAPIFALQGLVLYLQMLAFHIHVPIGLVVALTPLIMLVTSIPLTPVGLGSEQAAILLCFHSFGTRADLLALSLAVSLTNLIFRMALGVGLVKPLVSSMHEEQPAKRNGPASPLPGDFRQRHRLDWLNRP
jgi:uncharacterized membrane protein YbhN (UPF0104 family)